MERLLGPRSPDTRQKRRQNSRLLDRRGHRSDDPALRDKRPEIGIGDAQLAPQSMRHKIARSDPPADLLGRDLEGFGDLLHGVQYQRFRRMTAFRPDGFVSGHGLFQKETSNALHRI